MSANNNGWDDYSSDSDAETEKMEQALLKKFKPLVKNSMDEGELLTLIRTTKCDETKIQKEINNKLKIIANKGDEFGWQEVKGKKLKKIELDNPQNEEQSNDSYNYQNNYYYGNSRGRYNGNYSYRNTGSGNYYNRGTKRGRGNGFRGKKFERGFHRSELYRSDRNAYSARNFDEQAYNSALNNDKQNEAEYAEEYDERIEGEKDVQQQNEEVKDYNTPVGEYKSEPKKELKNEQNKIEQINEETIEENEEEHKLTWRQKALKDGLNMIKNFKKKEPQTKEFPRKQDNISFISQHVEEFTIDPAYLNPYREMFLQTKGESRIPFMVPMMPIQPMQSMPPQMQAQMQQMKFPYVMPFPFINYPISMQQQGQKNEEKNPNNM